MTSLDFGRWRRRRLLVFPLISVRFHPNTQPGGEGRWLRRRACEVEPNFFVLQLDAMAGAARNEASQLSRYTKHNCFDIRINAISGTSAR
jgi:hypothetical protein